MSCDCEIDAGNEAQKNVLVTLLSLNLGMFLVEIVAGILSESTALLADSLDMLADAIVYSISLYAVARAPHIKINAALANGAFQMLIGLGLLVEVARRVYFGSDPESVTMISIGLLALVVNIVCFVLISRHQNDEIHMRASWICSRNDVIANLGVIVAGVLVVTTDSFWPDLLIGTLIVLVVLHGSFTICQQALAERKALIQPPKPAFDQS
jgi:cation diffusion facilitator family transporter